MAMPVKQIAFSGTVNTTNRSRRRQRGIMGLSDSMLQILFMTIMGGLFIAGAAYGILNHARGVKYYDAGSQLATSWKNIVSACGTPLNITAANLTGTASAAANLQLLVDGPATLTATYNSCYKMSSVNPVRGIIDGSSGAYTVSGVPLTVGYDTPTKRITAIYTGMTDSDTIALLGKYSSNVNFKNKDPLLSTDADPSDPKIQFSAGTDNRTVTLLY